MNVFVLHAGQPELSSFLSQLRVPSGTVMPGRSGFGAEWTVMSWRGPTDRAPAHEGSMLQPPAAVQRAMSRSRRTAHLRLHGIPTAVTDRASSPDTLTRSYVIPVFQLDALGVFRAGGAFGPLYRSNARALTPVVPREESGQRPTYVRRAERAAVRAVYALGLEYAVVTLRLDPRGHPLIEALDPTPAVAAGEFAPLFAAAVNQWQARVLQEQISGGRAGTLLLGMDPEFVLRRPGPEGKIVPASRYFGRRGRVGCDSVRIGDRLVYPLVELRPSPAAEPMELLRNLYAAMRLAASRIEDASLEWLAGGMPASGLALGGHIHVSGVALHADLLRVMDNYMALPLVLLEDSTTQRRRPRYGALGDFRRQFHGGFEYRTLPSWIVSPKIALGVISLAKVVCEHYRELRERPLARAEMQKAYYAGDKQALRPAALALWSDLERTDGYARYRKALDRLKRYVSRMEAWNEQDDFRKAWKIPDSRV